MGRTIPPASVLLILVTPLTSISSLVTHSYETSTRCTCLFLLIHLSTQVDRPLISYNFGNPSASDDKGVTPIMQLLAQTDPKTAGSEAAAARKEALSKLNPELPPSQFLDTNTDVSKWPIASSTLEHPMLTFDQKANSKHDNNRDSVIEKYAPAVIGLLAANLVIGLVLVVLGLSGCLRRGGKSAPTKTPHYTPVKFKDEDDMAYHMPYATR